LFLGSNWTHIIGKKNCLTAITHGDYLVQLFEALGTTTRATVYSMRSVLYCSWFEFWRSSPLLLLNLQVSNGGGSDGFFASTVRYNSTFRRLVVTRKLEEMSHVVSYPEFALVE
jgi:hypothetical protein